MTASVSRHCTQRQCQQTGCWASEHQQSWTEMNTECYKPKSSLWKCLTFLIKISKMPRSSCDCTSLSILVDVCCVHRVSCQHMYKCAASIVDRSVVVTSQTTNYDCSIQLKVQVLQAHFKHHKPWKCINCFQPVLYLEILHVISHAPQTRHWLGG